MNHNFSCNASNKKLILDLEYGFKPCSIRAWSRDLKKFYGNECMITGKKQPQVKLVCHHMYSVNQNKQKKLCLLNGLCISDVLHKRYHKEFGMNSTPNQFIQFLERLKKDSIQFDVERLTALINWISFLNLEMSIKE